MMGRWEENTMSGDPGSALLCNPERKPKSTAHANGAHVTVDGVVAAVLAIGAEVALAAPVSGCG